MRRRGSASGDRTVPVPPSFGAECVRRVARHGRSCIASRARWSRGASHDWRVAGCGERRRRGRPATTSSTTADRRRRPRTVDSTTTTCRAVPDRRHDRRRSEHAGSRGRPARSPRSTDRDRRLRRQRHVHVPAERRRAARATRSSTSPARSRGRVGRAGHVAGGRVPLGPVRARVTATTSAGVGDADLHRPEAHHADRHQSRARGRARPATSKRVRRAG